jgi:hypothetical protein
MQSWHCLSGLCYIPICPHHTLYFTYKRWKVWCRPVLDDTLWITPHHNNESSGKWGGSGIINDFSDK